MIFSISIKYNYCLIFKTSINERADFFYLLLKILVFKCSLIIIIYHFLININICLINSNVLFNTF